ncbi:MAG TPA: glycosyltransferase family 4 protein, partial [Acidimicrobiales bacterium]|nr:glycosyltransferase family 4 protein [Acidimicrobiales bacterium]
PYVDAAVRAGVPCVVRIGEAAGLRTVARWLDDHLDPLVENRARGAFGAASIIVPNSHAAAGNYQADGFKGRYAVVPTGVRLSEIRPANDAERRAGRLRLGLREGERVVVCAASVWPVKGQAMLAKAIDHLRHDHPELVCVLVGLTDHSRGEAPIGVTDPAYAAAIEHYRDERDLGDRVRVAPFESNLRPYWAAADAAVFPSESESLPSAALEAMAAGLPVLASRVGDLPLLIEDGLTGWLCDPCDLGSLTSALARFGETPPDALGAMSARARLKIEMDHDGSEASAKMERILRAAAEGSEVGSDTNAYGTYRSQLQSD